MDFHINFDLFLSLGMVTDEGSQLNCPAIPGNLKLTHFKIATNCEAGYWIGVICYYYSRGLALVWILRQSELFHQPSSPTGKNQVLRLHKKISATASFLS